MPEGFGVIDRPVCGIRPGEKFDLSTRTRFVDAPTEGRLVVWPTADKPSAGPFEGLDLNDCEARLRPDGYRQTGTLGAGQNPVNRVEPGSQETIPEGFSPREGHDRFHIELAIENMGQGAVHLDWLTATRRAPRRRAHRT